VVTKLAKNYGTELWTVNDMKNNKTKLIKFERNHNSDAGTSKCKHIRSLHRKSWLLCSYSGSTKNLEEWLQSDVYEAGFLYMTDKTYQGCCTTKRWEEGGGWERGGKEEEEAVMLVTVFHYIGQWGFKYSDITAMSINYSQKTNTAKKG